MIIGENRAKVIENIKAAVKKGKMHLKAKESSWLMIIGNNKKSLVIN